MELNANDSEVNTKLNVIKYNNSELNRNDSEVNSQINRIK